MLKGQTEIEDDKKGVADVKLYNLRSLGGMTEETCLEVLQLVVDGKISYNEIQKTATVASQLQQTQAALIGVIDPTNQLTWVQMMDRFPEHTGREMLLNVFGKVGKGLTSLIFFFYEGGYTFFWESLCFNLCTLSTQVETAPSVRYGVSMVLDGECVF